MRPHVSKTSVFETNQIAGTLLTALARSLGLLWYLDEVREALLPNEKTLILEQFMDTKEQLMLAIEALASLHDVVSHAADVANAACEAGPMVHLGSQFYPAVLTAEELAAAKHERALVVAFNTLDQIREKVAQAHFYAQERLTNY
jgi:hypothetical protein